MSGKLIDAVVVKGKFHYKGEDGKRRMIRPTDKNPNVRVTASQLVAFKGVLLPKEAAKAQAAADEAMAKAELAMQEAEANVTAKADKVEDAANKVIEKNED